MNQPIIVTQTDARQLRALLERKHVIETTLAESVSRLKSELEGAAIVPDAELPEDVIALNSKVELEDVANHELLTFTLVQPEHADFSEGRISVLAPIGMALLGYRVGDEIEWPVPDGTVRVRIRKHLGRQSAVESSLFATT
jgi:regulator of nucleoside diphosphate kinase